MFLSENNLSIIDIPIKTYYMSFCDPDKPEGKQYLGSIIIDGADVKDALKNSRIFSINPGGEVMFIDITKVTDKIKSTHKYRLLNEEEVDNALEDSL